MPDVYRLGGATLYAEDCRAILPTLGPVDAIVTDPPYHLIQASRGGSPRQNDSAKPFGRAEARGGFMGQRWDGGDIAFRPETWAAMLPVLRPGGYLLAFGGTRTHHRIWCAIEDAGFVLQDTIMWVHSQGFPKGRTQLKPAFEPVVVAYKPGGKRTLQIDECRVGTSKRVPGSLSTIPNAIYGKGLGGYRQNGTEDGHNPNIGRWPANLVHDGSDEVMEAFAAFGNRDNGGPSRRPPGHYDRLTTGFFASENLASGKIGGHQDIGTAARFFASVGPSDDELLIWRAKANMAEWNPELANTADKNSSLSKKAAGSALSDAVTWASRGASSLIESSCRGLSTSVTPHELRTLSESAITAILKNESASAPGSQREKQYLNSNRANIAVATARTGITTITISHWRSDGSVAPVTFRCTPSSTEAGVPVLAGTDRFHYCAKASKADRANSKHPTVKPIALMRWLVRLVTPPGGTVLDPFAGSGTTGAAAVAEGRNAILIERESEYISDIRKRLSNGENQAQRKRRAAAPEIRSLL